MTFLGLGGAWLLGARFARTRRLRDLLLVTGLLMLTLIEVAAFAVPAAFADRSGGQAAVAAQWGTVFVAATFLAAAVCPEGQLVNDRRRPLLLASLASAAVLAAVEFGAWLTTGDLVALRPHAMHATGPDRYAVGWTLAIATTVLFSYAALRLARLSHLRRDPVLAMFAGAVILLAASRIHSLAPRWSSPRLISPGEGLRLFAFAVMFVAALRTELESRVRSTRAAVIAERRRIARVLHDGLAQDLAFVACNLSRLGAPSGSDDPVAIAARRALALSRGAIRDLSDSRSTSTHESLESIGHELQERFGLEVAVDVRLDNELASDTREEVARIAREAIVNAAKHGEPEHVIVSLTHTDAGLTLRVADDGRGLPHGNNLHPRQEGFGLRSMHERAAGLGGRLTLRDRRGGGAEIELVLP